MQPSACTERSVEQKLLLFIRFPAVSEGRILNWLFFLSDASWFSSWHAASLLSVSVYE
jgi:hypothetical protein